MILLNYNDIKDAQTSSRKDSEENPEGEIFERG